MDVASVMDIGRHALFTVVLVASPMLGLGLLERGCTQDVMGSPNLLDVLLCNQLGYRIWCLD